MNDPLIRRALANAVGTVAYIALVATFMQNAPRILGKVVDNSVLGPIAFLLLFVVSAAITGSLVLGKPALMYLDGQKREAVRLFIYTLGALAAILVIILVVLIAFRQV